MGFIIEKVFRVKFFWTNDAEMNNWSFPTEEAFDEWYKESKNSIEIIETKWVEEEMEF